MDSLKAAVLTSPRSVTWFGIGSFILLLTKVMVLDSIPAPHPLVSSVGPVVESLLSATVAAYIFFVISVQYPQVLERQRAGVTITMLAERVSNRVTGFLQMISGSTTGAPLLIPATVGRADVERLFKSVSPTAPAPMKESWDAPGLTWLGAMALHDKQCLEDIGRLWRMPMFVTAELAALLDEIEYSAHSAAMRDVREYMLSKDLQIRNADLIAWAANYHSCYQAAIRLNEYSEQYRAIYRLR